MLRPATKSQVGSGPDFGVLRGLVNDLAKAIDSAQDDWETQSLQLAQGEMQSATPCATLVPAYPAPLPAVSGKVQVDAEQTEQVEIVNSSRMCAGPGATFESVGGNGALNKQSSAVKFQDAGDAVERPPVGWLALVPGQVSTGNACYVEGEIVQADVEIQSDSSSCLEANPSARPSHIPSQFFGEKAAIPADTDELFSWFQRIDRDQRGALSAESVVDIVYQARAGRTFENTKNAKKFAQAIETRQIDEESVRKTLRELNMSMKGDIHDEAEIGRGAVVPRSSSRNSLPVRQQGGRAARASMHGVINEEAVNLSEVVNFKLFRALVRWEGLEMDITSLPCVLEIRDALVRDSVEVMILEYSHIDRPNTDVVAIPAWQKMMDPIVAVLIIFNAVTMGLAADLPSRNWVYVEFCFTVFFICEIFLKISIVGLYQYWQGHMFLWNWFDAAVVSLAVLDVTMNMVSSEEKGLNDILVFRVARLARLTKMMRLLRLLRLRVFRELALMVKGIISGLRTLFWAIVLLVFIAYALGFLLRQTVGEERVHMHDQYNTVLFDSMPWSMFMVFRCFTSDCALPDGSSLIGHLYAMYGVGFLVLHTISCIFVIFGIFNLIAATFVENVMEESHKKRQLTSHEEASRVFIKLRQLVLKFGGSKALGVADSWQEGRVRTSLVDTAEALGLASQDSSEFNTQQSKRCDVQEVYSLFGGQVSREAFNDVIQDPEVHILFDDLEVHIADRFELFDIIDADGNGSVDVSELILGILKLRSGGADKSDMVAAILGIRAIQKTTMSLVDLVYSMRGDAERESPQARQSRRDDRLSTNRHSRKASIQMSTERLSASRGG